MKSIIISAFPGTGKSWLMENVKEFVADVAGNSEYFRYHDSDSSKFSWIYDEDGNKTDQRDPNFPANYMEHIKSLMEEDGNIIFVSSHDSVREALVEAGFCFYIVRPDLSLKNLYLKNYRERGNDEKFIDLVDKNWDSWIEGIEKFHDDHIRQVIVVVLEDGLYMQQAIDTLINIGCRESLRRITISEAKED